MVLEGVQEQRFQRWLLLRVLRLGLVQSEGHHVDRPQIQNMRAEVPRDLMEVMVCGETQ